MLLLVIFIIGSISISFVCSILEATLLSITPSFISQKKWDDPILYNRLSKLKDHIDRPLAAILTLNTIAHTVGAAGVGAQVTKIWGNGYLGAASAIMTILILVLSEIIPKVLGTKYWRSLAAYLPAILNPAIFILMPFILVSDLIMKLIGSNIDDSDLRQEIKSLSLLAKELNKIDAEEQRVIANIIDLHEVNIKSILTPRTVCTAIKPGQTVKEFLSVIKHHQFSRYPVIDDNEEPAGILFRHSAIDKDLETPVLSLTKPAIIVPASIDAESLMRRFIKEQQHMALIYDEYGSWLGLVTLEDIIEKILGEPILDETDTITDMRMLALKKWEARSRKS